MGYRCFTVWVVDYSIKDQQAREQATDTSQFWEVDYSIKDQPVREWVMTRFKYNSKIMGTLSLPNLQHANQKW